MKCTAAIISLLLATGVLSCRKTYENPKGPDPSDWAKTQDGQVQMIVGIKNRFAVNGKEGNGALFNAITANGFTTNEIALKAGGNQDYGQLISGRNNLAPSNVVLTELWSNCLLINEYCSLILDNVQYDTDPVVKAAIEKYALLYKAMSIGTLAAFWQGVPVTTGSNAVFVDSTQALGTAITLLNQADALNTDALAQPYKDKLGTEINLKFAVSAMLARYYLMNGQYDSALARAASVPANGAGSRSIFIYNAQNPNPIYRTGYNNQFSYGTNKYFGLDSLSPLRPTAGDGRTPFYLPSLGFGKSDLDVIPLYLPGEMLLIQAEVHARKGDLANSKKFLDQVLTKTGSQDPFGVGATLPPYAGPMDASSLLQEIYKNRCIELYMSGLKLSDSRRFRRAGPTDPKPERNRNYYPYPLQERNGNPNTPADPLN
jgi:hypothetical protein